MKKLKKGSIQHLHALALGAWTALDDRGRPTVYAYDLDGNCNAIATGCMEMVRSHPAIYVNSPHSTGRSE